MSEGEFKNPDFKPPTARPKINLDYTPPNWSGNPPPEAKLEVLKGGKIIQDLAIKDKQFFVLGRQEGAVDFL